MYLQFVFVIIFCKNLFLQRWWNWLQITADINTVLSRSEYNKLSFGSSGADLFTLSNLFQKASLFYIRCVCTVKAEAA